MPTPTAAELFRHLSAEKSAFYRCIMNVFAAAKRQYRLQLRPDEVLAEAVWPDALPRIEEVNAALAQLAEWGNLESQPDTARVSSLSDFYRARFLYRLSHEGEAVEALDSDAIVASIVDAARMVIASRAVSAEAPERSGRAARA